jgi:HSP20 family protein
VALEFLQALALTRFFNKCQLWHPNCFLFCLCGRGLHFASKLADGQKKEIFDMRNELVSLGTSLFPRLSSRGMGLSRDWFRDYERAIDSALRAPFLTEEEDQLMSLRVDVAETDKNIEVSADLPGVDEKDIKVEIRNGVLWLSGEKRCASKEESKNMYRSERYYGAFERGISLPCDVEKGKVDASYKDGVLKVTLPKTPAAREEVTQIKVKH